MGSLLLQCQGAGKWDFTDNLLCCSRNIVYLSGDELFSAADGKIQMDISLQPLLFTMGVLSDATCMARLHIHAGLTCGLNFKEMF